MKLVPIALVSLALAGCQTVTTPASISFAGGDMFTAKGNGDKAQEHCQKYGKNAQYQPSFGGYGDMTFHCVK